MDLMFNCLEYTQLLEWHHVKYVIMEDYCWDSHLHIDYGANALIGSCNINGTLGCFILTHQLVHRYWFLRIRISLQFQSTSTSQLRHQKKQFLPCSVLCSCSFQLFDVTIALVIIRIYIYAFLFTTLLSVGLTVCLFTLDKLLYI